MRRILLLAGWLTCGAALLSVGSASAAVQTLSHNGFLIEQGVPVNGAVEMTFVLSSGASTLLTETHSITVENGFYSVVLGTIDQLDENDMTNLALASEVQLNVSVDGVALQPPLTISSVPFALVSNYAQSATEAGIAYDVVCDGCISADELGFSIDPQSIMPFCADDQVMRSDGGSWLCTSLATVDESNHRVTFGDSNSDSAVWVRGKLGVGIPPSSDSRLFAGVGYSYFRIDDLVSADENRCDCDLDDNLLDCPDPYQPHNDQGSFCDDWASPNTKRFLKEDGMHPIPGLKVKDDGQVGIGTAQPAHKLDVAGDINTSGKVKESGNDLIPSGMVAMFYRAACPAGWIAADGQNGTPDLRGQFIRGMNDFGTGARSDGNQDPTNRSAGDYQMRDQKTFSVDSNEVGTSYTHSETTIPKDGSNHNQIFGGLWQAPGNGLMFRWKDSDVRPNNVALLFCIKQ